jgi:hypothetical protein
MCYTQETISTHPPKLFGEMTPQRTDSLFWWTLNTEARIPEANILKLKIHAVMRTRHVYAVNTGT